MFALQLVLVGIFSAYFHAKGTFISRILDMFAVHLLLATITGFSFLTFFDWEPFALAFGLIMSGVYYYTSYKGLVNRIRHSTVMLPLYAITSLSLFIIGPKLGGEPYNPTLVYDALSATALFGFAALCRVLSEAAYDNDPNKPNYADLTTHIPVSIKGITADALHGCWHMLTGYAAYTFILALLKTV